MKKIVLLFFALLGFMQTASADLLLGNTTTGTYTTSGSTTQYRARGCKFTALHSGTVNSISAYITSASGYYCLGIYAGTTATPTNLLAKSNTYTALVEGWNEIAISDTSITKDEIYWLGSNLTDQNKVYHYDASADINQLTWDYQSFPTALADPWSYADGLAPQTRTYCIYGTGTISWNFVVIGDLHFGTSTSQAQVFTAIETNSPTRDFIISTGDNTDGGYTAYWANLTTTAADNLVGGIDQSSTPAKFISCPGNHDLVGSSSALTNWKTHLSWQDSLGNDGKYFYFDYLNARFIVLDAFGDTFGAQANFLNTYANSNKQDWLIIVFHAPVFPYYGGYAENLNIAWGPIIRRSRADFVFCGHHHQYVRTKKIVFGGTINPALASDGTAQIVSDNCNDSLHPVTEDLNGNGYALAYSYDYSQPAYLGYTEIEITGKIAVLKHRHVDGTLMDTETYTANNKKKKPKIYFGIPNTNAMFDD